VGLDVYALREFFASADELSAAVGLAEVAAAWNAWSLFETGAAHELDSDEMDSAYWYIWSLPGLPEARIALLLQDLTDQVGADPQGARSLVHGTIEIDLDDGQGGGMPAIPVSGWLGISGTLANPLALAWRVAMPALGDCPDQ
jgi:hypothetical protein